MTATGSCSYHLYNSATPDKCYLHILLFYSLLESGTCINGKVWQTAAFIFTTDPRMNEKRGWTSYNPGKSWSREWRSSFLPLVVCS